MFLKIKKKVKFISKKIKFKNLISSYQYSKFDSPLIYYWDYKVNWGDSINKFLFESILGTKVFVSNQVFNFKKQEKITGVGSILGRNLKNYSIWGSGFLSENHSLIHSPNDVLALRGKHTAKKIKDLFNIECSNFGDPGLLFKEFYNSSLDKKYSVGIIPHFMELDLQILIDLKLKYGEDIRIISPTIDIFQFADEVKQCEKILSSSLHGLVLAESYGIPTARVKLSNRLIGGDYKFEDYYSGVGIDYKKLNSNQIFSIDKKLSTLVFELKDLKYSSEYLINSLKSKF